MQGLVVTSRGIEETASAEVKELTNSACKAETGCVVFELKDFRDLCLLCYKCQSADRVACLIGEFEFNDFFEDFGRLILKSDFHGLPGKWRKFKVECIRIGNHSFNSVDVETKAAEMIIKKFKSKKIDMKGHEIIFLAYVINNKCYFGVDFAGFELNKRAYKIFLHSNSLRGTIAYALARESGFKKNEIMLDPFSRDGVVAIESAFYATEFPLNCYKKDRFAFLKLGLGIDFEKFFMEADKKVKKPKGSIFCFDRLFKFVNYSKKNAKIAGVDKFIDFSRVELDWLDIKFKKKSVDRIATSLPASKNANLGKIYDEFFYQSDFILKDEGAIAVISRMPDLVKKCSEKRNFAVLKEKEVWSGGQMLKILVFKKKSIK